MRPDPAPIAVVASHARMEEKLIFRALEARGLPYVHVDDRQLAVRVGDPGPAWAAVLNRGISATRRLEVSRLCEAWGVPVVNASRVVATCDDKLATALALTGAGLPVPPTAVALSPDAGLAAIEEVGYPAVLKPINGSWGRLVSKLNDRDAAEAVLAHRRALPSPQQGILYTQAFVKTPGHDIRVIVIGGRALGAIYRCSEHWIANTAQRAVPRPCPLTAELEQLCLRAEAAVGGGAVAIDVLENIDGELLVNELNSSMEFHGFVEATGVDVAGCLVDQAWALARRP